MNEISERDMERVSGGNIRAEIDAIHKEWKRKLCDQCAEYAVQHDAANCTRELYFYIRSEVMAGRTPQPYCAKKR